MKIGGEVGAGEDVTGHGETGHGIILIGEIGTDGTGILDQNFQSVMETVPIPTAELYVRRHLTTAIDALEIVSTIADNF